MVLIDRCGPMARVGFWTYTPDLPAPTTITGGWVAVMLVVGAD